MYTTAHFQASRSTKVFGNMLLRISTPPLPQTRHTAAEESSPPALSEPPPQILISLPSPGLNLNHDLPDVSKVTAPPPKRLAFLVDPTPRNRSTLPSTWKPKRPPSPLPQSVRKKRGRTKHKRSTLDSPFIPHSPLPPLPPLVVSTSPVLFEPPQASYINAVGFSLSHSLHPAAGAASQGDQDDPDITDRSVKMYLRARAMKTATYAIHDGGIISPP
ncbi:hypothetical protein BDZ94DRAFT_1248251 [Collybia nuda]|uniref:Uncharacterized protein n=1 Tax=Collybia nuda TaxID=64659 RepID=A0A9P6CID6_9AGAR|nr:hypothetical protein BDZ94DRAFT_1248251 [Collybia nuda]